MRSLCRGHRSPRSVVSSVMWQMDFFRDEPLCGPRLLKCYHRAGNEEEIENVTCVAIWLRLHCEDHGSEFQ